MKIAFGCDHVGFELKSVIIEHLISRGCAVEDMGCDGRERVDYPVYAGKVARAVASGECDLGVLICGTGVGISIAANKVRGIRAAVCSEPYSAELTRRHNNANIIAFGSRVVGPDLAIMIVDHFLDAEFEGGRHQKRLDMISEMETKG